MTVAPGGVGHPLSRSSRGAYTLLTAVALTPFIPQSTVPFQPGRPMALGIPANAMGLIVSGDVDGLTIYTDRYGRKIAFPKAPPKEPPTQPQAALRARFRAAQAQYMALSFTDRSEWERLACRANLSMTGQNLLIHVAMQNAFSMLATLMNQTGVTVTPPTLV